MSRISVRGIAVASATAVTTVGAVVGVASGSEPTAAASQPVEAADATLLNVITTGQQADKQAASFIEQAQWQQTEAELAAQKAAAEAARRKAAAEAAAKKAAAEKKAEEKTQQSLLQTVDYTIAGIQTMAQQIIGDDTQYKCFSWIVDRESGWNYQATNPYTHAYGLVQALPGSKMASAGSDWLNNPATQIKWGLSYMNSRYGSPCKAKLFWESNNWY